MIMDIIIFLLVALILIGIAILILTVKNGTNNSLIREDLDNLSENFEDFNITIHQTDKSIGDVSKGMDDFVRTNYEQMIKIHETLSKASENQSVKISTSIREMQQQTEKSLNDVGKNMTDLTEQNYKQLSEINRTLREDAEKQTEKITSSVSAMQESNEKRLEEMRKTVDEKLAETLNERLGASFTTVSEQLSNVYKSLGEMKELSSGVTDNVKSLNKVLTNVKARGTWAEVQLANILDETIPNLYDTNVKTNPAYNGQVEFAVRIPSNESEEITYLPIDSKFPMEDYIKLQDAAERGAFAELEKARKNLYLRIRDEAKMIERYIAPPHTTSFAIMYLATEGLYAEIAQERSGLTESLHSEGIMIAGPSTITALLNSLAVGFRTIAINRKAGEVWNILSAAKAQYEKFGAELAMARKKIDDAGKALDNADKRNNIIQKRLRQVETLEINEADDILQIGEESVFHK